ncbi:hypothetical protein IWW50_006003 [Coemansia erecta]|nr:hypothetical protein IWW50_006003 [Coemansia erecta]
MTETGAPPRGSQVELRAVDSANMLKVRNLHSVLFPVRYTGSFYKGLLQPDQFARLAYYNSMCVGLITCRKQPLGFADTGVVSGVYVPVHYEMYMMTLGVLAPCRRLGIARGLLESALAAAAQDPSIKRVVLHVQIDNDDALRFYHKHGFATQHMVERYYKLLDPPHAYLLEYSLR